MNFAMAVTLFSAAAMEAALGRQLGARLYTRPLLDLAIPLARLSSACEINAALPYRSWKVASGLLSWSARLQLVPDEFVA